MSTVWRRATSDDKKEQRKAVLLEAGARLLASHPIEDISLNAIAREANISKANVYRYFESREALLLHLALDAGQRFCAALGARLRRLEGKSDAEAVAEAIASSMTEHETFARLSSVLSTVLERNVSTEVVARFKASMLVTLGGLLEAIVVALPELSPADAHQLLQTAYFLLIGTWPAAHPPPAVQAALARPELADACVVFEPAMRRALVTTILGLRAARP